MNSAGVIESVAERLKNMGAKFKMVSIDRLADLKRRYDDDKKKGLIIDDIEQTYTKFFEFDPANSLPSARSIIAVAVPQPRMEAVLNYDGRTHHIIIPQVYHHGIDARVTASIEAALNPNGYKIARVSLPLKLLAAHSGLARYGKNNIAYVDGMGSFFRLMAFFTDFYHPQDNWQPLEFMDECTKCVACIKKCPTGAINKSRSRIDVERCITLHNESPADFPEWIESSWHNCLIGCLFCQDACPVNKKFKSKCIRVAEFCEEETARMMQSTAPDNIASEISILAKRTGLDSDLELLPRNLKVLLDRKILSSAAEKSL